MTFTQLTLPMQTLHYSTGADGITRLLAWVDHITFLTTPNNWSTQWVHVSVKPNLQAFLFKINSYFVLDNLSLNSHIIHH